MMVVGKTAPRWSRMLQLEASSRSSFVDAVFETSLTCSPNSSLKSVSASAVMPIDTHDKGFYDGFSRSVTIPSKIIVSLLIMWAIFFPVRASETLSAANSTIIASFAGWYVYLVAALIIICVVLAMESSMAAWPEKRKLK